jgi:hypothetical protein
MICRYTFVISDVFKACQSRIKYNVALKSTAKAMEILFEARNAKQLSYSAVVLSDKPVGYWRMNDPTGSKICPNLGSLKEILNAKISSDVVLEQDGYVLNEGLGQSRKSMRFPPREEKKNTKMYPRLDIKYNPQLAIENPDLPFSIEAMACVQGGYGKSRTICMTGRMALIAFKSDIWVSIYFIYTTYILYQ